MQFFSVPPFYVGPWHLKMSWFFWCSFLNRRHGTWVQKWWCPVFSATQLLKLISGPGNNDSNHILKNQGDSRGDFMGKDYLLSVIMVSSPSCTEFSPPSFTKASFQKWGWAGVRWGGVGEDQEDSHHGVHRAVPSQWASDRVACVPLCALARALMFQLWKHSQRPCSSRHGTWHWDCCRRKICLSGDLPPVMGVTRKVHMPAMKVRACGRNRERKSASESLLFNAVRSTEWLWHLESDLIVAIRVTSKMSGKVALNVLNWNTFEFLKHRILRIFIVWQYSLSFSSANIFSLVPIYWIGTSFRWYR